jgi:hypothetical protein
MVISDATKNNIITYIIPLRERKKLRGEVLGFLSS